MVPTLPDQAAFYQDKARPETLKQLQHMGNYDAFFAEYRDQPRWQALAETLIGEAAQVSQPEWFNKPPQTEHPTPPHQDNFYFNLTPPNVASIWLALDPVDEENGCLRYSPGSHLKGIRPHNRTAVLGFSQGIADYGPQDQANEVAVHLQPGDAVVHHGEIIHRADPNRSSQRHRRAFAMVFEGVSCKIDEEGRQRYQEALQSQHQKMGLETSQGRRGRGSTRKSAERLGIPQADPRHVAKVVVKSDQNRAGFNGLSR